MLPKYHLRNAHWTKSRLEGAADGAGHEFPAVVVLVVQFGVHYLFAAKSQGCSHKLHFFERVYFGTKGLDLRRRGIDFGFQLVQ